MNNLVPDGWKITDLGSYINIGRGYAFKSKDYKDVGVKIVRVTNIKNDGRLNLTQNVICIDEDNASDYAVYELNASDVLIVMVGATVGKLARIEPKYKGCLLNQNMWRLVVKSSEENCQDYFYYAIKPVVDKFLSSQQGSARGFLTQKDFSLAEILTPPLPEQQKIAQILISVDEVIEKTQAQIDKLKDLKTGMMQELLTKGIGHTEFKDSPVGSIPVEWAYSKFSVVTQKIQDGTHFSPQSKDGECLYLTSKNVQNGKLDLTKVSYISKEEHDEIYKRCDVKFGDVLLTKDGANTGNCAMNTLRQPFSLLSSVALLRCDENICINQYMYQYILSPTCQKIIQDSMTGNAITRLTLTIIKNLNIALPSIDEQHKIVSSLSAVDNYIDKKLEKLSSLQNNKKALMQDLLTGKVRVNTAQINTEVAVS